MAENKKISELPVASSLTGAESIEVLQGGINKQAVLNLVIGLIPDDFVQSVVDTSGSAVNLDFENTVKGIFTGSVTFDTNKTVSVDNETRAMEYDFFFEVSDVDVELDFGPDTRSWHANFLNGVFTAQDVGLYKVRGTRYGPGGLWMLDFKGVYSVGDAPPIPTDHWVLSTGIWNNAEFWDNDRIWRDNP